MDARISDLTALTTVVDADILPITDISDTTQAASGTTKKVTRANLLTSATITGATLSAGTVTVAPLTFTSGTNLTTPVAGSMEYDGTDYYLTFP